MKANENNSNSFPLIAGLAQLKKQWQPSPQREMQPATSQPVANPVAYIRPVIDMPATIAAYRKQMAIYNKKVPQLNREREKYNNRVVLHQRENPPSNKIKNLIAKFHIECSSMYNNHQYNDLVNAWNNDNGLYLKKRKIQTLKVQTVEFFAAFIHEYSCQLQTRNKIHQKADINHPYELPKLELNPHEIKNQLRNGELNIETCSRTIRSQRQRLEEAGILEGYSFHSHKRPVKIAVNNLILQIFEAPISSKRTTENQQLTKDMRKVLPHTNVSTRTLINKLENKEKVNNFHQDKEFATAHNPINFLYKNTQSQGVENFEAPAEKNKPAPKNLTEKQTRDFEYSENLRDNIEDPYQFCAKLGNGEFDYYKPIKKERLEHEAATGNLTEEEFRELLIQDFFKHAAKLWRGNNAKGGCWGNAYQIWMNEKLLTFTGKPFSKTVAIDRILEYRERIDMANKWFKRRNWTTEEKGVWYPSKYFDPASKNPKDIRFEYTKKFYNDKIAKRQKAALDKKQRSAAAKRREEQYKLDRKNNRLLDKAIRKYLKKAYTLNDLTSYVMQNLPKNYLEKLPVRLEQLNLKMIN